MKLVDMHECGVVIWILAPLPISWAPIGVIESHNACTHTAKFFCQHLQTQAKTQLSSFRPCSRLKICLISLAVIVFASPPSAAIRCSPSLPKHRKRSLRGQSCDTYEQISSYEVLHTVDHISKAIRNILLPIPWKHAKLMHCFVFRSLGAWVVADFLLQLRHGHHVVLRVLLRP